MGADNTDVLTPLPVLTFTSYILKFEMVVFSAVVLLIVGFGF